MFDFVFFSAVIFMFYMAAILLNVNIIPEFPTEYELKRKARDGDVLAKKQAWVKKHSVEAGVTIKLLYLIFQGAAIVLLSIRLGHAWAAVLISLVAFGLMRFAVVKDIAPKMFGFWERFLVSKMQDIISLSRKVLKPIYGKSYSDAERTKSYYSEEEFIYRFGMDSEALSEPMRKKIDRIIKGSKTKAKDIMLDIKSVPKVDINLSLTPVIYDELHKKGYDMAVAFQGAEDNLVGLLYLSGAEAVHQLNTPSAVRVGDKMEQGLQYVTEDVRLDELVAGFLQGGQNAVLVTGAGGRVSGVITARKLLAWISGS